MHLSKRTAGQPLSSAELRQRRNAARARWAAAGIGGAAAGAAIGAVRDSVFSAASAERFARTAATEGLHRVTAARDAVIANRLDRRQAIEEAFAEQLRTAPPAAARRTIGEALGGLRVQTAATAQARILGENMQRRRAGLPVMTPDEERARFRTLMERAAAPPAATRAPAARPLIGNTDNKLIYDRQLWQARRRLQVAQRWRARLIAAEVAAGQDPSFAADSSLVRPAHAEIASINSEIADLVALRRRARRLQARAGYTRVRDGHAEDVQAGVVHQHRGGETGKELEARIRAERNQVRAKRDRVLGLHDRQTARLVRSAEQRTINETAESIRQLYTTGAISSRILRASGRGAVIGAVAGLSAAGLAALARHVATAGHRRKVEKLDGDWIAPLFKAATPEDQMGVDLAAQYRSWIDRLLGVNQDPMNLGDGFVEALAPGITESYAKGLRGARIEGPRNYRIDVDFDLLDPAQRRHMAEYALDRIVQITDEQREAIRTALQEQAVLQGIGPKDVARTIKEAIGLTSYQRQQVQNFRQQLRDLDPRALERQLRDKRFDPTLRRAIETNTPLSAEQIDAMVDAYHRRFVALRAQTIARTEAVRAESYATVARGQQVLDRHPDLEVTKRWLATGDNRTRETHRDLNGKEAEGMTGRFTTTAGNALRWPHDTEAPADEVINCLLPGTRIFAPDLLAASKREYDGDVITFKLANGAEIACTINHPILTSRGWQAAQFLQEGDRVVCGGGGDWQTGVDNGQQRHPRIEDVEYALRIAGSPTRRKVVEPVDFHREGAAGQVDVVALENRLLLTDNAALREHFVEPPFTRTDLVAEAIASGSLTGEPLRRLLAATDRSMRGSDLRLALALAHLGPFASFGFAASADSAAAFGEGARDDMASHAIPVRQGLDRDALVVGAEQAGQAGGLPTLGRMHDSPWRQGENADVLADGGCGDAKVLAHLLVEQAGLVQLSEVVAVDRRRWHGHVYNLETRSGIYLAENACQHNCRCTLQYVFKPKRGQLVAAAA